MQNISIINGRLIDPKNDVDEITELHIANGQVVAVGQAPSDFAADDTIDATGLCVCPGFIDLSARFREPGQEHISTIASESMAALASGITAVCIPPDTNPVIDTPAVIEFIQERAAAARGVKVFVIGALSKRLKGNALSEMLALKKAGVVGVGNALSPIESTLFLKHAFEYAATYDLTVFVNPVEPFLARSGVMHDGIVSTRLGLPGIPACAETIAIGRALELAHETGARVHFCRLSSERSTNLIVDAKTEGLAVTADVAAHQLHLTEIDLRDFNSDCYVLPPARSERDKERLCQAVVTKRIEAICSDHQPLDIPAKFSPIEACEPGISALETFLPLALRLHQDNGMSLLDLIAAMTVRPAEILQKDLGHLSVGATADICVFDAKKEWSLSREGFVSQGSNSPFSEWELQGKVVMTLVDGRVVFGAK